MLNTTRTSLACFSVGLFAIGLTACGPPRAASVDKALVRQHIESLRMASLTESSHASQFPCEAQESLRFLPGSRSHADLQSLLNSLDNGRFSLVSVAVALSEKSESGTLLSNTTNVAEADPSGALHWKQACHFSRDSNEASETSRSFVSVPMGFSISNNRRTAGGQTLPIFSDLLVDSRGKTTARPLRLDERLEIPFTGAIPRFTLDPQIETTPQGHLRIVIKDSRTESHGTAVEAIWTLRFARES